MGQIHRCDLPILQGESFSILWPIWQNVHRITVDLAGGETGSLILHIHSQETVALTPDATAAEWIAALNALPVVNAQGQVAITKTGGSGSPAVYTITWPGTVTVPGEGASGDDAVAVLPTLVPQRTVTIARLPRDLSGYTARSQARTSKGDNTATLLWDSAGSPAATLTLGGAAGTISLALSHTVTQAMTTGGYYDIHLLDGAGLDTRIVEGSVLLQTGTTFR